MTVSTKIIKNHIKITYILNKIFYEYNKLDKIDDDEFNDFKHRIIENYIVQNKKNMKKFIDDYGVFNAIKSYEDNYGKFKINDDNAPNYCQLSYDLIDDYISENINEINTKYLDLNINIG